MNVDGGWAEYVKVPSRGAHRIADEMSDITAAAFEPFVCTFGAVDNAGLLPGEKVLIFGDGPAAMYFTQIAKMMGAGRICTVFKQQERADFLQRFGADDLIHFDRMDEEMPEHAAVREQGGFQLVIDAVGLSDTVKAAVRYASAGGRLILYGFKDSHTAGFPHRDVIFKALSVFGRTNSPSIWPRAIDCVSRNRIALEPMVERIVSPLEARDILLSGEGMGLKTVIRWKEFSNIPDPQKKSLDKRENII